MNARARLSVLIVTDPQAQPSADALAIAQALSDSGALVLGVREGDAISPYYDSMIAKLITHGRDRQESMARMKRALGEFVIEGIKTTLPLHRRILDDSDFQKGHVSTTFLDRFLAG